jgi:hypothetical protein
MEHISLQASKQPDVIVCVKKELQIHQRTQVRVKKGEDALEEDKVRRGDR